MNVASVTVIAISHGFIFGFQAASEICNADRLGASSTAVLIVPPLLWHPWFLSLFPWLSVVFGKHLEEAATLRDAEIERHFSHRKHRRQPLFVPEKKPSW